MPSREALEYFREINPNIYGSAVDYGDAVAPLPERTGSVVPYSGTENNVDLPAKVVLYENVSIERIELPA